MKPEIQKREQYGDEVGPISLTYKVSGRFERMGLHPFLIRGKNGENSDLLILEANGKIDPSNFKEIIALIKGEVPGARLICVDYGSGEGRSAGSIIFPMNIKPRD